MAGQQQGTPLGKPRRADSHWAATQSSDLNTPEKTRVRSGWFPKRIGLAISGMLLLVWVVSLFNCAAGYAGEISVLFSFGCFIVAAGVSPSYTGWIFEISRPHPTVLPFFISSESGAWSLGIPMWLPLLAVALPTAIAWRREGKFNVSLSAVLRVLLYLATLRMLVELPLCIGRAMWMDIETIGVLWVSLTAIFLASSAVAWSGARLRKIGSTYCPGCRYNLSGLPTAICPECGIDYVVRQEQLRYRHRLLRRRVLLFNLAALIVLAFGVRHLRIYYDSNNWFYTGFIVCRDTDTSPDAEIVDRLQEISVGMPKSEVVRILGTPDDETGSSDDDGVTWSKTLWYGNRPLCYYIGPIPPISGGYSYDFWEDAATVRFGTTGLVEEVRSHQRLRDGVIRLR